MLSGEARPIVIFEKLAFGRFSFLIGHIEISIFSLMVPEITVLFSYTSGTGMT
jgi:hypothetical protein